MLMISSGDEIETNVEQGDLMLVWSKSAKTMNRSPILGIFDKVDNFSRGSLRFKKPAYFLREPFNLNGVQAFSVARHPENYVGINLIAEGYVGIEDIVKKLQEDERWKPHCEWISDLKRPYVFPKIRTAAYLDIKKNFRFHLLKL